MLDIKLICIGKLKEKFYIDAVREYTKRLGAYCRLEIKEIPEARVPSNPSEADIDSGMLKEANAIIPCLPKGTYKIAMCIEGTELDSTELADMISKTATKGFSRLCFIVGGSDGLHDSVKSTADLKLSMSRMTFPHHLARVMLLEQIYRSFKIIEGGKYHK